jgi:hypothetical protein
MPGQTNNHENQSEKWNKVWSESFHFTNTK